MRVARGLIGAVGVALILVGAWYVLGIGTRDFARLVSMVVWLAGGVVLHDAVIAPLVLLVGVVLLPRLPASSRAPAAAGMIVLLSVTLLAIPVIGRFGSRPDVPSLLDRSYGVLWLVFAALVVVAVVVASLLRSRRKPPP